MSKESFGCFPPLFISAFASCLLRFFLPVRFCLSRTRGSLTMMLLDLLLLCQFAFFSFFFLFLFLFLSLQQVSFIWNACWRFWNLCFRWEICLSLPTPQSISGSLMSFIWFVKSLERARSCSKQSGSSKCLAFEDIPTFILVSFFFVNFKDFFAWA